jgi:hypothetical protein
MATPRLYGAVSFRYDPTSEAAIFQLVGADGSEITSLDNGLPVDNIHHLMIHAERVFVHNNAHTGIAAGASYWHVLTTGSNFCNVTDYHATADSAPIWLALSEAPTWSGGTSASFINRYRSSAATTQSTIKEGCIVTAAGTHLEGDFAAGTKQTGGSLGLGDEWLLKPNTDYAFLIRNDSNGAATVSFHLEITEI